MAMKWHPDKNRAKGQEKRLEKVRAVARRLHRICARSSPFNRAPSPSSEQAERTQANSEGVRGAR